MLSWNLDVDTGFAETLERKASGHPFENVPVLLPPNSWLGPYPTPCKSDKTFVRLEVNNTSAFEACRTILLICHSWWIISSDWPLWWWIWCWCLYGVCLWQYIRETLHEQRMLWWCLMELRLWACNVIGMRSFSLVENSPVNLCKTGDVFNSIIGHIRPLQIIVFVKKHSKGKLFKVFRVRPLCLCPFQQIQELNGKHFNNNMIADCVFEVNLER